MILTWDIIRRILEVLWVINIALAVWTVFRSRRSVVATWAWMLVLTILPGIGFILYLFFGRQLSHDEIFAIQEEQRKHIQRLQRKSTEIWGKRYWKRSRKFVWMYTTRTLCCGWKCETRFTFIQRLFRGREGCR